MTHYTRAFVYNLLLRADLFLRDDLLRELRDVLLFRDELREYSLHVVYRHEDTYT